MKEVNILSKNQRLWFLLTIVLTKFALSSDFIIYPITNEIFAAFPEHRGLTNYIISGPTLLIMVVSLLLPTLLIYFSKRNLMITGICLFTIGGIFNVTFENVYWIAGARTLIGIGQGILSVLSVTLLADIFTNSEQLAKYVGILNACANLAAMILSYLTGILAGSGWKTPFLLYWFSIPMLISAILFLPKVSRETPEKQAAAVRHNRFEFSRAFLFLLFIFTVFSVLRTIVTYYMSSYTTENQLGGSELAAAAASLSQLFAFSGAMLFSILYRYLKQWLMPFTLFITASAFFLWLTQPTVSTVYLVYCMVCGASGCLMAYCYTIPLQIMPPEQSDTAVSILTAMSGISGFIPTYLVSGIMKLSDSASFTATIPFYTAAAILLLIFSLLFLFVKRTPTDH